MHYSPLKKKFNLTLNTSRGARASMQDSYSGLSKSPFRGGTDLIMKCNQLEQELHRANQQRKLQALELDDLSNQFIKKCKALQESEYENTILQQQLQAARQQDDIQKLQNMLRQKNQIILEWSNKFSCVQKKLENESNLEQQLHKQQLENEAMKQQLTEIRTQQKLMQDNYRELKEERNNYYQKVVELSSGHQKSIEEDNKQLTQQFAALKKEKQEFEEQMKQLLQKKDKWKVRFKNLKNEIEYNQIHSHKSSEQLPKEDELNETKDKLQQLEVENQYLREQNIDLQTQIQSATDKLLKQQLQTSMEQSQAFSFKYQDQYESYEQE